MGIFRSNMVRAAAMEATSKTGARYGATKFSDLTAEEFAAFAGGMAMPDRKQASTAGVRRQRPLFTAEESARLASQSKNWVTDGAVTHVKWGKPTPPRGAPWATSEMEPMANVGTRRKKA
eukprot:TRINITY_DN2215_c0_g4_i1.p2 TRINITY_DN2215_c0_g4~~TRINITY_DN2215_c0_g4_i1.p2  ORF type:complete len:120 (+),score=24.20 TRINITY_DN2215_c0_g4_i1:201-560(+)